MGHFGREITDDDGNVIRIEPEGWIWDQLGSSTLPLEKCDIVFSISCHMVTFVTRVQATFPDVGVPDGWPPTPYDDDRKITGFDAVFLLKNHARGTVKCSVNKLIDPPCCCEKVDFKIKCDREMARFIRSAHRAGQIPIDYCAGGGYSKEYTEKQECGGD